MNDYMRALHQRFYREPDFSELEEDIENTRQEVRDCLDKLQRRRLMHLVDTQNLLREETSLASFMASRLVLPTKDQMLMDFFNALTILSVANAIYKVYKKRYTQGRNRISCPLILL